MAVDPMVNGIVEALTGMAVPEADSQRVRDEVEQPNLAMAETLGDFQHLITQVTGAVARNATGQWSEAYVKAMSTFAGGDGADYVRSLRDTASQLGHSADEFAYELDYTNRMIIAQAAMFFFEWALTLVLAIFNPIEALVEQAFLRALFRVIFRSTLLRFLAAVAAFEALNIGLGAAMDGLVRWTLALNGEHTSDGASYQRQSIQFGAVQGALAAFIPFLSGPLGTLLAKGFGRNIVGDIERSLDLALRDGLKDDERVLAKDLADPTTLRAATEPPSLERDMPFGPAKENGGPSDLPRHTQGDSGPLGGFARTIAVNVAGMAHALDTSVVDEVARDVFRQNMGSAFTTAFGKDMGVPEAAKLGEGWADAFLTGYGRKTLAADLDAALDALPVATAPSLRTALSRDIARSVRRDLGAKAAHVVAEMPVNAAHQMMSEGLYNATTTGHFTSQGATGAAGAFGGALGHTLSVHATHLGARLHGLTLPSLWKNPPATTGAGIDVNTQPEPDIKAPFTISTPLPSPLPTSGGDQAPSTPTDTTRGPKTAVRPGAVVTPAPAARREPHIEEVTGPRHQVAEFRDLAATSSAGDDASVHSEDTTDSHLSDDGSSLFDYAGYLTSRDMSTDSLTSVDTSDPAVVITRPEQSHGPIDEPTGAHPKSSPHKPGDEPPSAAERVRTTDRQLDTIAKQSRVDAQTQRTYRAALHDARQRQDWPSADELLREYRDHIGTHITRDRLEAFDAHVGAGFDEVGKLGVPREEWQERVDAVEAARRSGDTGVLDVRLRAYTALVERHLSTDVLAGRGGPRPNDGAIT
ncbi:WXG100-like domain-containing protein, partial [Streptomyces mirabilis]